MSRIVFKKSGFDACKSDIADLAIMHAGVLIYDSELSKDGKSVVNAEHYGEYAAIWALKKFPVAMFVAVDEIYRANRESWRIKKNYVRTICEVILQNVGWEMVVDEEHYDPTFSIVKQLFEGDSPTLAHNDSAYLTLCGHNYYTLSVESDYNYDDFDGKNAADINELREKSPDLYEDAVNTIFLSVALNYLLVDSRWKYINTEKDYIDFTVALADIIERRDHLTKKVLSDKLVVA
jgi:hypothetical protein